MRVKETGTRHLKKQAHSLPKAKAEERVAAVIAPTFVTSRAAFERIRRKIETINTTKSYGTLLGSAPNEGKGIHTEIMTLADDGFKCMLRIVPEESRRQLDVVATPTSARGVSWQRTGTNKLGRHCDTAHTFRTTGKRKRTGISVWALEKFLLLAADTI